MKNVLPLLISFSPFSPFTPLLSFSLASPSSSFAFHCCAVLFSLSFPVYVTQYHQYSSNNDYYNDNHNRCRNNNYLQVLLLSPNFVGFSYIATQKKSSLSLHLFLCISGHYYYKKNGGLDGKATIRYTQQQTKPNTIFFLSLLPIN